MQEAIKIGGVQVKAGQRLTVDLPMARLYTHTEMTMPVHIIHGKKPGPRLFVSAAIHGDEIIGVEIIRRLLQLKILDRLHGTLLAIPIVNAYGFINRSRYLPDRRDLNRSFPGSKQGSLASRLASLFMEEIAEHCTHGIDLHSGSNYRSNLPQVRACLDDKQTEHLARVFGTPVAIHSRLRDGSLRQAVADKGIPMLLYEAGEALRFSEVAIQAGLRGIVAVMREIGMVPRRTPPKRIIEPMIAKSTTWVRAPISGTLIKGAALGTQVSPKQLIGTIGDPFGEREKKILSPTSGIVIGRLNLPLVHAGDALFHIASLENSARIESALESLSSDLVEEDFRV